mgnify:CR=1 FL=1
MDYKLKSEIDEQYKYMEKVAKVNEGQNLKYAIYTMGCQLNENDSEKISGMLEKMGYSKTEEIQRADFVVFNTCCVRENAEDKLFGKIGEMKRQKEEKETIIAIGGCMMQEEHIVEKLRKSYPFVDIIFGTHTMHKLAEDVYHILEKRTKIEDVITIDGEIYEGLPIKRNDKTKASVTIMYGCNNFCTYCIVPYVRGRERSRTPKDILKEIRELADNGYKEITLLGQNVNSYDGGDGYKFSNLLRDVNEIEKIEKIRFVSPHPKDFKEDVIDAIRDCKKVSKIIHLPLQSGSSNILKKMNRRYTKEQYLSLVKLMKEKIPNVVFSTDIIVGFPEESKEDFEDTLDVVRKVNFEQVFMFIYSRRVGTPADKMENQVPEEIKHERFNRLKELVESMMEENNKKYIGTTQSILVEGKSKNNPNMLTGRTDSNKVVVFEGKEELINKVVNLKIVSEHMWYLKGEIIN